MTHQSHSSNTDSKDLPSIPGDARIDPEVPVSAKEAPLMGVEAAKETSFKDAVAGHAKYFAGKLTGNDKEVQQGAARLRGEEDSLPQGGKSQHAHAAGAGAGVGAGAGNASSGGIEQQGSNTAPPLSSSSQHGSNAQAIPAGATAVSSSTGAGTGSGVGSARGTATGATSGAEKAQEDTATFH